MKATITSTDRVVEMHRCKGRLDADETPPIMARVWEGVTEGGVPFTAYITSCMVAHKADNAEFIRDLSESPAPSRPETYKAIDMRYIVG